MNASDFKRVMPQPYLVYRECPCLRGDAPQRTCGRHAVVACLLSIHSGAIVAAQWLHSLRLHSVWLHSVPCALCQTMWCVRLQPARRPAARRPAAPPRSRAKRCSTTAQFSPSRLARSPSPVSTLAAQAAQPERSPYRKPPAASIGSCRAFFLHSSFCSTHLIVAELSFLRFYLKYTFDSLLSGQGRRHGSVGRKEAEGGRCAGGPQ